MGPNFTGQKLDRMGNNNRITPDDMQLGPENAIIYDDMPALIPITPASFDVYNQHVPVIHEQGIPMYENPIPNAGQGPMLPQNQPFHMPEDLYSNLPTVHSNPPPNAPQNINFMNYEGGPQIPNPEWMPRPYPAPLPIYANNIDAEFRQVNGNGDINLEGQVNFRTPQNLWFGGSTFRYHFQSNQNVEIDVTVTCHPTPEQLAPDDHQNAVPVLVPLPIPVPIFNWPNNHNAGHGPQDPHGHDPQQRPPYSISIQGFRINDLQQSPEMNDQRQHFAQPIPTEEERAERRLNNYNRSLRELRHFLNQYRHEMEQYGRVFGNLQREWRETLPRIQQQQQEHLLRRQQRRHDLLLQLLEQEWENPQHRPLKRAHKQPTQQYKQQKQNLRKRKCKGQSNTKQTNTCENKNTPQHLSNLEDSLQAEHQQQQQNQLSQKREKQNQRKKQKPLQKKCGKQLKFQEKTRKKSVKSVPKSKNGSKDGSKESKQATNQSQQTLCKGEYSASAQDDIQELSACSNSEIEYQEEIAASSDTLETPGLDLQPDLAENVPDLHCNQRGLPAEHHNANDLRNVEEEEEDGRELVEAFGDAFGSFCEDLAQRMFLLAQEQFAERNGEGRDGEGRDGEESEDTESHVSYENNVLKRQHPVDDDINQNIPKRKCKSKIYTEVDNGNQNMPSTSGEGMSNNQILEDSQEKSIQNNEYTRTLDVVLLEMQLREQIEFFENYKQELEELRQNAGQSKQKRERTAHWVETGKPGNGTEEPSDGLSEEVLNEQFRISAYFQEFKKYTLSDMLQQIQMAKCYGRRRPKGRKISCFLPKRIENLIAKWTEVVKQVTTFPEDDPLEYSSVSQHLADDESFTISDGEMQKSGVSEPTGSAN